MVSFDPCEKRNPPLCFMVMIALVLGLFSALYRTSDIKRYHNSRDRKNGAASSFHQCAIEHLNLNGLLRAGRIRVCCEDNVCKLKSNRIELERRSTN